MAVDAASAPWARTPEQVAKDLGTDLGRGLSTKQVEARREEYGFNELDKEPGTPLWKLVLQQFDDMLVKVCGEWCAARSGLVCARKLAALAARACPACVVASCSLTAYH